jgi:hypothetical protein
MTEAEWRACDDPERMLSDLSRWSANRKFVLFGCACLRSSPLWMQGEIRRVVADGEERAEAGIFDPVAEVEYPFDNPDLWAEDVPAWLTAWTLCSGPPSLFARHAVHILLERHVHGSSDWVVVRRLYSDYARCIFPPPVPPPLPKKQGWLAAVGAGLLQIISGSPERPAPTTQVDFQLRLPGPEVDPAWLTSTVVQLASGIYEDRAFDRLPILADALMDAGCDHPDVLAHCRSDGPHVRGCWVVDLLLGKA